MYDVLLLSGISGLTFDSLFLSLPPVFCLLVLLLFFLTCHFYANGDFFSPKIFHFSLRVRHFCLVVAELLGDDSWEVVCAASVI